MSYWKEMKLGRITQKRLQQKNIFLKEVLIKQQFNKNYLLYVLYFNYNTYQINTKLLRLRRSVSTRTSTKLYLANQVQSKYFSLDHLPVDARPRWRAVTMCLCGVQVKVRLR